LWSVAGFLAADVDCADENADPAAQHDQVKNHLGRDQDAAARCVLRMSPKPIVTKMVTVKYSEFVRVRVSTVKLLGSS
jgi:hypothetical protein